jgi:hypothetical protein
MVDNIASSMAVASCCTMRADLLYHRQLELIEGLAKIGVPTDAAEYIAGLMLEHRDHCHEWLKSLIMRSDAAPLHFTPLAESVATAELQTPPMVGIVTKGGR